MKTLTPFVALSLLASALSAQQQLVLPDYQYLCESTTQLGQGGSTAWWRGSGGRFQVLYEASHFTGKAGAGPLMTIDKLLFRGESGEPNLGGQSWAGVVVSIGVTSLDPGDLVATFATNLAPGGGDATLMAPAVTIPLVTVDPSIGSTPNNYNIVVDLSAFGGSYAYDPTGGLLPNLLIDITLPFAATLPVTSGPVMAMENTPGPIGTVRGWGVTSGVIGSPSGSLISPPVIGIEFSGDPGGYNPPIPARNEFYGAACGGEPCSFYQSFLNGQPFDLGGSSLTLTPNVPPPLVPAFYTVSRTATPFVPPTALVSTLDDEVVTVPLPWTFLYPCGGAGTTTIKPCTNGYVWLDPAMGAADFVPKVADLLGAAGKTSRLAPFWYDFDCGSNLPTHPWSGLYVDIAGFAGTRICAITWWDVGVFNSVQGAGIGGHAVHHMQVQIHEATGVVEFIYGPGTLMPLYCSNTATDNPSNPGIVGFSPGSLNGPVSADPQSRDLSHEWPFSTYPELSGNIGLSASTTSDVGGIAYSGRLFGDQMVTWNVHSIPAGQVVGVWVLGFTGIQPGFPLAALGPTQPECVLSVYPDILLATLPLANGTDNSGPPIPILHGWEGVNVHVQYVSLGLGFNYSSNALKHTIGLD